jgi:hypothetical protein
MPSAGMKMIYTSGWPKNQKRCCHSSGLPPSSELKKLVLIARSSISSPEAMTIDGMAKMTIHAVTSMAHTKTGTRFSDIPGARNLKMVTISSEAAISAEISVPVISAA